MSTESFEELNGWTELLYTAVRLLMEGTTAVGSNEALTVFKAHPQAVCIVLDLTMPHMDGAQCLREFKHRKSLEMIPV